MGKQSLGTVNATITRKDDNHVFAKTDDDAVAKFFYGDTNIPHDDIKEGVRVTGKLLIHNKKLIMKNVRLKNS